MLRVHDLWFGWVGRVGFGVIYLHPKQTLKLNHEALLPEWAAIGSL